MEVEEEEGGGDCPLLEVAPGQGTCGAAAAAMAVALLCSRGHVGLSLVVTQAALGVAASLGHPGVLAVTRTGPHSCSWRGWEPQCDPRA